MFRSIVAALLVLGVCSAALAQEPSSKSPAAQQGTTLNLNSATSAELEALPGIGKVTADRIIEYRQKSGGFKKVEDLMNVRGVGEKSFLKLKPLVSVAAPRAAP